MRKHDFRSILDAACDFRVSCFFIHLFISVLFNIALETFIVGYGKTQQMLNINEMEYVCVCVCVCMATCSLRVLHVIHSLFRLSTHDFSRSLALCVCENFEHA